MDPRYLELEQRADALAVEMKNILDNPEGENSELTGAQRDRFFNMQGEEKVLLEQARALRDEETSKLRDAIAKPGTEQVAASDQAVADYKNFIKTGEIKNASMTTTDANGGYIVPEPSHGPLVDLVRTSNPFFAEASVFTLNGDTKLLLPTKATHGAVAVAAETATRSEQNAPTFGNVTLEAFDHYTDQRATQTFLDSVDGSEDMMLRWIYEDIFTKAELDMVAADGSAKSAGFFANTSSGYTLKLSGAAGAIAAAAFPTCLYGLNVKYRANAKWYMNSATLATAVALAFPGLTDTPLVQFVNGQPTILGKPVVEMDSAPTIGASAYPVAVADMAQAYAIGVHRNISVLRDPYTATPYVRFYGLGRIGGTPWDNQAAVLMKSNNS